MRPGRLASVLVVALPVVAPAAFAASYSVQTFTRPANAPASPEWGIAVAILGDTIAVGNPQSLGAGEDGTVVLFDRASGAATGVLHDPSGSDENYFGGALEYAGGKLLATASDTPAAYFLDPVSGAVDQTFVSPDQIGEGHGFGQAAAAMGGDVLLSDPTGGPNRWGIAYRFDPATGLLRTSFPNPRTTPPSTLGFGFSVAGVGGNILVGDIGEETDGPAAGAAYLFDGDTGALLHTFRSPTPVAREFFGYRVAAVGDAVAIAAPSPAYLGGTSPGRVYLFDQAGTLLHTFEDPTPVAGGDFGFGLGTSDGDVFIGVPNGPSMRSVYRFDAASGGLLEELPHPGPVGDNSFGRSIDVMNGSVVIGSSISRVFLFEPCGNGSVWAGEECDDGNTIAGDGCSDTCRVEPCPLDPSPGCHVPVAAGRSSLVLSTLRKRRLAWKWKGASGFAELGDPVTTDDYFLCIYPTATPVTLLAAPAGSQWTLRSATSFRYEAASGAPDRLASASLRASSGRAKLAIIGGETTSLPGLPLTTPMRVQLHRVGGGTRTCWDASFASRVRRNEATAFAARSDGP